MYIVGIKCNKKVSILVLTWIFKALWGPICIWLFELIDEDRVKKKRNPKALA